MVKLSNLHKIGKYGKEIGKIINKVGKNRNFHKVSITLHQPPKHTPHLVGGAEYLVCLPKTVTFDNFLFHWQWCQNVYF